MNMKLLAQNNPFGEIDTPGVLKIRYGVLPGPAIGKFIQLGLRTLIVVAGLYALFNLIFAGYAFMGAGDDSKKVEAAWAKIWQTMLGLTVAAGSFVLAAIIGKLLFDDSSFLLKPTIPGI